MIKFSLVIMLMFFTSCKDSGDEIAISNGTVRVIYNDEVWKPSYLVYGEEVSPVILITPSNYEKLPFPSVRHLGKEDFVCGANNQKLEVHKIYFWSHKEMKAKQIGSFPKGTRDRT